MTQWAMQLHTSKDEIHKIKLIKYWKKLSLRPLSKVSRRSANRILTPRGSHYHRLK